MSTWFLEKSFKFNFSKIKYRWIGFKVSRIEEDSSNKKVQWISFGRSHLQFISEFLLDLLNLRLTQVFSLEEFYRVFFQWNEETKFIDDVKYLNLFTLVHTNQKNIYLPVCCISVWIIKRIGFVDNNLQYRIAAISRALIALFIMYLN